MYICVLHVQRLHQTCNVHVRTRFYNYFVDEMFIRFKDIVRKGRPKLDDKTIEDVTTGQVFTANQAITFGLIDKIGFLEDAIARAVVLADLQEDSVRVIQYKKPQGLFDEILGGASQARSYNSLEMLVEWTTPRA